MPPLLGVLLELLVRRFPASPEVAVALVQTEVAERIVAGPGSRTRGLAGVWTHLDYDAEIVRTVKATCFWPRPDVGSSVIRLVRHHRNDDLPPAVRDMFHSLTKQAFEHRRKQLGAIFKGVIESTARAEQLSVEEFVTITKTIESCQ